MKRNLLQSPMALALLMLSLAGCVGTSHRVMDLDNHSERDGVLAVVARSFDAIASKGPHTADIWREVLLPTGSMSSVRERDGKLVVRAEDYAAHYERLSSRQDPSPYLERMWDPTVLIDGDIAVVWTRYDFWLDGALSHGGTDVIVMLRTDEGWRIASFAWTSEVDAPPSPLGPPTTR
ncbi:MAG: hypothetical protein ACI9EF_002923 [Pseudohongiellaceae bacterium]|jgi:hypothetical protein